MRKLARLAAAAVGIAASVGFALPMAAANASVSAPTAQRTAAIALPAAPTIVPQIARQGCPSGRTHLTKVWIFTGRDYCVRGTGSFNPNSWDVAFCAGTAHGHIIFWTETGVRKRLNFAPGNFFFFTPAQEPGGEVHITDITITSHSGTALCPPG